MNDHDSLHQKASQHYLHGDVAAALRAWKHLLQLAPADERAVEGVRLCETMLDAQQGTAPPAATAADPGEAAAEPDELADLDFKLNLDGGHEIDQKPREADDPAAAGKGMDLEWALEGDASDGDSPAATPADAPAQPRPATQGWEWDSGEEAAGAAAPVSPAEQQEATAALELRRRANELLANALVEMEAGNHDEALSTLDRVLILDEENEAARSLKLKIAEAKGAEPMEVETEAPGPVEFDVELGAGPSIGLGQAGDAVPGEEIEAELDSAPLPVTELPPEDALVADPDNGLPAGDLADDDAIATEFDGGDDLLDEGEAAASPPRSNRRRMAVAAALLVAAGGAALYFFGGFGGFVGEESRVEVIDPVKEAAAAAAAVEEALTPLPDGVPAPGGEDAPVATAVGGVSALLDEANAKVDAGDYAAAIVQFNRALELDPANTAAAGGLTRAGEMYRDQRENAEQWRKAQQAFEDRSYRDALRMFYRLPATEDPELVERYKFNGWYNVGLQALKSDDCAEARSNFKDAREVQGSDKGLTEVMRLARTCARDQEFHRIVSSLPFRTLND